MAVLSYLQTAFLLDLRDIQGRNFQPSLFQHTGLDLRIGCPILKFGHIHIFQRELNPNLFRVDLTLGKQDNRLAMCRR